MRGGGQCLIEPHAILRPEIWSWYLGKWDKRVARIVLEELEYNSTLFIGVEELAMCGAVNAM
ncbi:hypothetical protein [Bacillus mobilis]|uniref:hypothetical protein n=1 Tax=Bacillus mobilis TaxID=2026190 RepID=UPI0022E122B9|nr:hypothetical protein [Bacillus mobilis]